MYVDKIRETFERSGYSPEALISQSRFQQAMSNLMRGQPFDHEVAEQLWEQAARGNTMISINRICETINDGISILIVKIEEINQDIRLMEREKQQSLSAPNQSAINKIDRDLEELYQDKEEFEEDLRIVALPFGINPHATRSSADYAPVRSSLIASGLRQSTAPRSDSLQRLTHIMYLTLAFALCEIIVIYDKYDFVNLILLSCLLSIYLLNHFDNLYIKFTLILLAVSQVLDIIWLFMLAGQKWSPPVGSNESTLRAGYLRIVVILTIVVIGLKVPIGYFLYLVKNTNEAKYELSMGMFKVILSANKSNPITRNLNNALSNP